MRVSVPIGVSRVAPPTDASISARSFLANSSNCIDFPPDVLRYAGYDSGVYTRCRQFVTKIMTVPVTDRRVEGVASTLAVIWPWMGYGPAVRRFRLVVASWPSHSF